MVQSGFTLTTNSDWSSPTEAAASEKWCALGNGARAEEFSTRRRAGRVRVGGRHHGRTGNRVIRAGYRLLGLQTFFTAGPKEVRAWTVRVGTQAPQAAGVIHTDFERGFIRAEVAAYEDFAQCNGEQGAREAGKLRLEGKDYVMHDGDVVHFRFNV